MVVFYNGNTIKKSVVIYLHVSFYVSLYGNFDKQAGNISPLSLTSAFTELN